MKIDFSEKLYDLDGEPLEVLVKKEKVQMTLGYACGEAMLATIPHADQNEQGKSKWERWELAGKIIKADKPIGLTAEEIVSVKKRVGMTFGPPVVGPVFQLLEGKEEKEATENE